MAKIRTMLISMRGAMGSIVRLTPEEFYEMMDPRKVDPPKVSRCKATFLPGVNPAWDAEQELKAVRVARGASPQGFTG